MQFFDHTTKKKEEQKATNERIIKIHRNLTLNGYF